MGYHEINLEMSKTKTRYAFFDYDGTLAPGDSIIPFLKYAKRKGWMKEGDMILAFFAGLLWKLHLLKDIEAKAASLGFLKRMTEADADRLCAEFCTKCMEPVFYQKGIEEMKRLHEEGYTTVLVSASPSIYMKELTKHMPADRVLATRVSIRDGSITGVNCKGEEKVERIREMLAQYGEELDVEHSHAYGDSLSDAPMLLLCGSRHCVNAKEDLLQRMQNEPGVVFENWQTKEDE